MIKRLHSFGPSIWTVDQPQRYHGIEVGKRMTVIQLDYGCLMLISPVSIDETLADALGSLGSVTHILAPNNYHHGSLCDAASRYPNAAVHVSAGLMDRYVDLNPLLLGAEPHGDWAGQVNQTLFDGLAVREWSGKIPLNEAVFCHRPSRTLILTDAAHHITSHASIGLQCVARLSATHRKLAPTLLERMAITERAQCKAALERMLEWDFDAVIMAHGELIERDGKACLAAGYDWLLESQTKGAPEATDEGRLRRRQSNHSCG